MEGINRIFCTSPNFSQEIKFYISFVFSCEESDQYAKGCKFVDETPIEVDLITQLDPARDLQRLHSLIITNMNIMQKYFDRNAGEEMMLTRQSLNKLGDVAMQLEQIHRKHRKKENKEMKIGSQQEPIVGDDNYLRGVSCLHNFSKNFY